MKKIIKIKNAKYVLANIKNRLSIANILNNMQI